MTLTFFSHQALLACAWGTLMLPLSAASQVLRCHIETGEQTHTMELSPTYDAYDMRSLDFDNGFRLSAVWLVPKQQLKIRVNDANRGQEKAHRRADKFFKKLQIELASWLEIGSTKTALVYGKPE